MDPTERETILSKLYADSEFAALKQPREQFEHILAKYLHRPADVAERDSWLRQQLATVGDRLNAWNETYNRKSYKTAKKLRDSARRALELMDKATGGAYCQPDELDEEQLDYLQRAEQYYSKAILAVPYVATEQIAHNMDKVAGLKVSLYQERAEVRFRTGKYQQALVDASLALHFCDLLGEQYSGLEEIKVLAVRCLAELALINRDVIDDIIDFITTTRTALTQGDDDKDAAEYERDQKARYQAAESLNDMIAFHGQQSNFSEDKAPQLCADWREPFFRYQVATELIEIKRDEHKGRYFVAREAIPAGTWLLVEKPYSVVVHKDFLTSKCNFCLKDLEPSDSDMAGYPCDYCKEVRFCCLNCVDEAYHLYHRHECGILGFLLAPGPLAGAHTFRILSMVGVEKAIQYERQFKPSSYSVEEYLAEEQLRKKNAFALGADDRMALYRMSTALAEHRDKYSAAFNAWHAMQALDVALALLTRHPNVIDAHSEQSVLTDADSPVYGVFLELLELCLIHIRRVTVNVFGQFDYSKGKGAEKKTTATGQILVGSLINHSCAPNLEWSFKTGHVIFKSNRAIESGEELNITYGQTRAVPFQDRQNALQHYHFLCGCSLCRADIAKQADVPRCQVCLRGPLVKARTNAGCLDCFASTTPSAVKKATEELQHNRTLLELHLKMILAETNPVNPSAATTQPALNPENNLKSSTLAVVGPVETTLRSLAYRGTSSFTSTLRSLAQVYQHLDVPERALELVKLFEEADSQIEATLAGTVPPPRPTRKELEDKLSELNFWTEICRQHFAKVMASRSEITDEQAFQVTILLFVRFLKLSITYVEERLGPSNLGALTVAELLDRPVFSDAKLVYILSENKKAALMAILNYAKSRCNE